MGCDFDFGATANIFDQGGTRYAGVGSKNGVYYAFEAATSDPAGKVAWSTKVVFGGVAGGFIGPSAYDGKRIYGATALGDVGPMPCDPTDPTDTPVQDPSLHVFNPADGTVVWQASKANSVGATSVANGVVFVGVGNILPPALQIYDAETGTEIKQIPLEGAMNSGVAIVGDMIFFGSGNSFDGAGGAVHAFRLP
jgi:outer membrane protein assembly factor BamB